MHFDWSPQISETNQNGSLMYCRHPLTNAVSASTPGYWYWLRPEWCNPLPGTYNPLDNKWQIAAGSAWATLIHNANRSRYNWDRDLQPFFWFGFSVSCWNTQCCSSYSVRCLSDSQVSSRCNLSFSTLNCLRPTKSAHCYRHIAYPKRIILISCTS